MNQIGIKTAPGYDNPLEMLRACHERILDQCNTLHKLVQHLVEHGNDLQARQAAQAILRYFDTAGKFHHQDEEINLFPQMMAGKDKQVVKLVAHLLHDHQEMNSAWSDIQPLLLALVEGQPLYLDKHQVTQFTLAYQRHIALENDQLLPLAARMLNPQQMHDIAVEMAARRGVNLSAD